MRAGVDASHVVDRVGPGQRAVSAIASLQFGAIAIGQLLVAGLTRNTITYQLRSGRLHQLFRGVYLVGHTAATERTHMLAAVLACGPCAVLSHFSAARLWELLPPPPSRPFHISIIHGRRRSRDQICVHRAPGLTPDDVRVIDRIPVVSPPRALLGIAAVAGRDLVEDALSAARVGRQPRGQVRPADFERLRERTARHAGWATLGAILDAESAPDYSRSAAEAALHRVLVDGGLGPVRRNARVAGYEVDFLWPECGLVVELDGYTFHSSQQAFDRDRAKWAELKTAGLEVLSFSAGQARHRPFWVASRVAAALERLRVEKGGRGSAAAEESHV